MIERKTELGMIEYLIAREKGEAGKNATFKYCYDQWRAIHDQLVDANTVHKYNSDYKRFLENSTLTDRRICEITKDMLLEFMADSIKHPTFKGKPGTEVLNRRAAKSLWGYITDTFE